MHAARPSQHASSLALRSEKPLFATGWQVFPGSAKILWSATPDVGSQLAVTTTCRFGTQRVLRHQVLTPESRRLVERCSSSSLTATISARFRKSYLHGFIDEDRQDQGSDSLPELDEVEG